MTNDTVAGSIPSQRAELRLFSRFVPYIGMFILALLLWIPFSFKTTGLIEEWGVIREFDNGHSIFFITPQTPIAHHSMRPFEVFFHNLAYSFDPDSFLFYNVFQMLFILGKMVVSYWIILEFLPKNKLLAFIASALFILYPADTAIFTFRAIHIHSATLIYLIAAYLLIKFWKERGRFSWLALLGAAVLLIFSLWQYQIALPAALVTPFVLLYFSPRPNRRFWIAAGVWYGATVLAVLYALWALNQVSGNSYEAQLVDSSSLSKESLLAMLDAILLAYKRQVTGWFTAFGRLRAHLPVFWPYVAAGVGVFAAVGGWMMWRQRGEDKPSPVSPVRYIVLAIAGIGLIAVGMAIYLPIPSHRSTDFRIYFLSMLGSALVLAMLLNVLSRILGRYRDVAFIILSMPFIGLGLVNAFQLHQQFVNYSLVQQKIIQDVVMQAPEIAPGTHIIMIDRVGMINTTYGYYYGVVLPPAIQYVYGDTNLSIINCPAGDQSTLFSASCEFEGDTLHVVTNVAEELDTTSTTLNLPIGDILIFTTDFDQSVHLVTAEEAAEEFGITGYDPQARITSTEMPYRAQTMFSCMPALSCYRDPYSVPSDSYDIANDGDVGWGWREPEMNASAGIFRWSVSEVSTVEVNLASDKDLILEFNTLSWLDASVIDSLSITINGHDIPLTYENDPLGWRTYKGVITPVMLEGFPSRTRLIFIVDHLAPVPEAPNIYLGIALNNLRIRPSQP